MNQPQVGPTDNVKQATQERAWRKLTLTPDEARLRDTTAIALIAANPNILRDLLGARTAPDFDDTVKQIVDIAFIIADEVLERRQK